MVLVSAGLVVISEIIKSILRLARISIFSLSTFSFPTLVPPWFMKPEEDMANNRLPLPSTTLPPFQ